MKRILTLVTAICLACIAANAQTINATDYFSPTGITQKVDTLPVGGIVPGSAGAGQTYDFSLLNSHLTSTSAYIAPASGVLGSSFPSANKCMHQDTNYYYFDTSATKVDFYGVAGNLLNLGVNKALVYSNPEKKITFPSVFGTTFSDAAAYDNKWAYGALYQGVWVDSLRDKNTITINSSMDGSGTVITPNRTYTSCLRQNVLKHSVDTTWAKIFVGGFHYWIQLSVDTSNTRTYSYITDSIVGPLVNIELYPDSATKIYQVRWNSLTLAVSASRTNVTCNGTNNGTATAVASGGKLPYTYSWNDPGTQSTPTATGLGAGSFVVTVTDGNSTVVTATVTITQPAALTATVSASTNVLCNGNNTGSATALAGGGTPSYAYSWNSSPVQNTATATGLIAGSYIATITDVNGCVKTATATITQPTALTPTITTSTNVLCKGSSTGSATASASGGTGGFTYSWNTIPIKTTATITGLAAGTYSVTVKDANNCSAITSVTITEPAAYLNASLTSLVNVACNGNSTGSAGVTASGGTGTLTYLWNSSPTQSTASATGLPAGNYTATVTDGNGCVKTVTAPISQPTAVSASISSTTNASCNSCSNGKATVTASGGTGTKTYSWNSSPVQTTATATGLAAGSYTVTVTDAAGCTKTATVTITQPGPVTSTNYFSASGITMKVDTLPVGGIVPGSAGTGQTYDFTLLHSHLTSSSAFIAPASGILGSSYPASNICMHQDTNYNYFDSSSTKLDFYGVAGNLLMNGVNNALVYSNPEKIITFPSAYSTSFTDAAAYDNKWAYGALYQGVWVDSLREKNIITKTSVMDGSGQVKTPTRTYNSCLRQNVLKHSVDSTWAKVFGSWILVTHDTSNTRTYSYMTDSIVGPVVNIEYYPDSSAIYEVRWNSLTFALASSKTNVTCNGAGDGTATAVASGGKTPYTYSWSTSPVQTTATATGLTPGSYVATVTDALSAVQTITVTITQPAAVTASIASPANVLCKGSSTGSATVTGGGGTGALTYYWNSSPAQNTATATGLAAGTYIATVTDANGCAGQATVTITEPAVALAATVSSSTNVLCKLASTGSATASASGGASPYTYSWNTIPIKTTVTVTGLAAGTYSCTVTDANGCTSVTSVTITEPATALSASLTSLVNVACKGNSTGSAGITASGGTGTLTYLWNSTPTQSTAIATGLPAGNYTATVTDGNGCVKIVTAPISQPATSVSVSVTASTPILCKGNSSDATASASGGTGALTYLWNSSPAQSTATATGLAAGDYTVTATDSKGCSQQATVTITEPATAVSTSLSASTDVLCKGNNTGDATVTASGGTGTLTYVWNTSPVQSTANATGLPAGDYTATVTDANGCTATATVSIFEPATAVTASVSVTDASCGNADGDATVSSSGGTGSLNYSWNTSPVQTTATATGLVAGSYTVTVTDGNGCSLDVMANVSNLGAPTVSVTATTDVTCNGGNDGDATATASGGTGTLTYLWNDTGAQTTLTATGLSAGTYNLTVTDGLGCITIESATINEPTAVTATITATNVNCNGGSDGSATAAGSGGTGAITYLWSDAAAQTTATATGLAAGDYTVALTDASGCAGTATVTITEPALLTASASVTDITCNGNGDGTATATTTGGTGTITYLWSDVSAQATATATGLVAGDYTATITDANGCAASATVTITEPALLTASASVTNISCNGNGDGTATASVSGGTGTITYLWSDAAAQATATATGLIAGDYTATITDANGCAASATVTITEPAALTAAVTAVDESFCGAFDGSISAVVTGGTAPYSYLWSNSATTVSQTGLAADTFYVTITDANGCTFAGNDTVNCVIGISQYSILSTQYSVYPNPGSGNINVEITVAGNENYTLKVVDITGQVVYNEMIPLTTGKNVKSLDLSSYSDGLYMIQLISKDGIKSIPQMISR